MPVTKETATDIAYAYREVETATELLAQVEKTMQMSERHDIRDVFGRRQDGLQLGVPTGVGSQRLFNVPWPLAKPIIETHIAQQKAIIATLSTRAALEIAQPAEEAVRFTE